MNDRNCQEKSILSSNKGFSLIELLVVVAIMAVATGLITITYAIVQNANVSKVANTLDTVFNKARIQSMAKGTDAGQLTLWIDDGILYYTIGEEPDPDAEPLTATAINSGVINISYTDTSGALVHITDAAPDSPVFTYRFNSAGMVISNGTLAQDFEFSHGNRRVGVIFYLDTGKHMTELR